MKGLLKPHDHLCTMRFIHLLLAFVVGVSAANFKRGPPLLCGDFYKLTSQTQILANELSLPSINSEAAVVILCQTCNRVLYSLHR